MSGDIGAFVDHLHALGRQVGDDGLLEQDTAVVVCDIHGHANISLSLPKYLSVFSTLSNKMASKKKYLKK